MPKVIRASLEAVRETQPDRSVCACVELHTFSSLHPDFLPQYRGTLLPANRRMALIDPVTAAAKGFGNMDAAVVRAAFDDPDMEVYFDPPSLEKALLACGEDILLLMSSGALGNLNIGRLV